MPIPYAGSSQLIPVNPSGYNPTDPNRNRDLLNNVVDPAMEPDRGVGSAPPRDPYMASLPPAGPRPSAPPPVTTLQPGRTSPFSRADAQALAALDPRALEEAKGVAALPESTPAKITGSFGGKSFEMQPSARVDRNALAKLYAAAQERKGQERQDAVRSQEQSGRERIVSIPGQQGLEKRKAELEAEERITGKKLEADAPARAADIAAKQAQTAAATGAEQRAQAQAARQPTPQQEAIDAALAQAEASPFAQTPEGRKRIAALYKQSTAGKALPPEDAALAAEGAAGPGPDIGSAAAEVMADPGIAAIIARAKETKPGVFSGSRDRQTNAAARALAERAIKARLARSGASPEEAQEIVTSILGPNDAGDRVNLLVGPSVGGLSAGNTNAAIRPR